MKRTAIPLLRDLRLLDDDVLDRHVGVSPAAAGLDPLDFVDDVLAFHDLAEHAVAPALGAGRRVIQEGIVLEVDEELARGRMRLGGPRHGYGIAVVLEAVAGLVLDGLLSRLLAHSRLKAAALDHESVDDAVEHRVGVEPRFDIGEEILDGLRRALRLELERNDAEVGVQLYHGSVIWRVSASPIRSPRASAGRFRAVQRPQSAPWRFASRYPSPRPPVRTPRTRTLAERSRDSRGSRCP